MTILLHRCYGRSPPQKLRSVRPWADFRDALGTGPRWLPNCRSGPDGIASRRSGVARPSVAKWDLDRKSRTLFWDGVARPERYGSYLATRSSFFTPHGLNPDPRRLLARAETPWSLRRSTIGTGVRSSLVGSGGWATPSEGCLHRVAPGNSIPPGDHRRISALDVIEALKEERKR
jgi:hypothetical protein